MKFFYFLNRLASSRLTLGLVLLILLALLIWFGGPRLSIDGATPLTSQTSRLVAICALGAVFLSLEVFRRWRLERLNRHILHDIGGAQSASSGLSERSGRVREGFMLMCETLREHMGVHRRGRRYLDQFSWYVLLGASGSGRSTALSNSGLEFPLETPATVASSLGSSVDSREYCGWRVTDEAVFIDAPGAFVTQPGPEEASEWQDLLDCLKSARPRRPLNGVILTLPADRLLDEALEPEALDRIRHYLQDMLAHFGTTLPVYVIVTKCDKVVGFVDFFSNLDAKERERPVGVALPLMEHKSRAWTPLWSPHPQGHAQAVSPSVQTLTAFAERYRDFTARLAEWTLTRLHTERQSDSRRRIFAFPQQMQALSAPLGTVLRRVFGPSRFRREALLRGVYFCSARQEGPVLDLLMKAHQEAHALQPPVPSAHNPRRDAAFFFKGFIQQVLLPEHSLVGLNPRLERRRLLRLGAAWAAAGVVIGTLCVSWWLANDRTGQQVAAISEALDAHDQQQTVLPTQPNVSQAALVVAPLRRHVSAETAQGGALQTAARFGAHMLRSPVELSERAETAYHLAATTLVRPAVLRDLGHDIVDLARAGGPTDQLRSLLALYLGLSETSRFDSAGLNGWAAEHARGSYPLSPEKQADIIAVVGDVFDGLDTSLLLDENVVTAAREQLYSMPPAERLYAQLTAHSRALAEVSLDTALDIPAASFFTSVYPGTPLPSVPGFYSEPGFYEHFLLDAPRVIHGWRQHDWLLGSAWTTANDERLFTAVSRLYARDYVSAWTAFLGGLSLWPVETPGQALRLLEALLAGDSPLDGLVRTVSLHTVLPLVRGSDQKDAADPLQTEAVEAEDGSVLSALGSIAGEGEEAIERQRAKWPGTRIQRAFASYHALHNGKTGNLPGLAEIRAALNNLHGVIAAVANASNPEAAAFDTVRQWIDNPSEAQVGGLRRAAAPQPEPLRRMLFDLSDQALRLLMTSARHHLDARWQSSVLEECQRAIRGRYPTDRRAETVIAPDDFGLFFARDGVINQFFEQHVSPFVVTSGDTWQERSIYGHQVLFSADALAAFRNAGTIREAFNLDGAGLNGLEFTITPAYLDNRATRVTVRTENRTFSYRHEPPRRFRMKFADEAVEISITDKAGVSHVNRLSGPWAWFRMFDRFQLQATSIPDRFHLMVNIGGLEASFNIAADSTLNPLTLSALTDFGCEERLQ